MCEFLEQSFGHLDALVNNAGIITKEEASGLEVKLAAVRETLETNTLAPLHLSQALVPLLKRSAKRPAKPGEHSLGFDPQRDQAGGRPRPP